MDSSNMKCGRFSEAADYLDGELDAHAVMLFERHLQECPSCKEELAEQRRLLCALNLALSADEPYFDLPSDFAQTIATNAESDMSGLRKRVEHGRAFRFCLFLTLASFALLGGATLFSNVSVPIRVFARASIGILGFVGNAVYDAGIGAAVILRPLGRRLIFESLPVGLIAFLLFAFALALLPRLIVSYHRAQITE